MIPFPNGKYSVIYADPPWRYSDRKCNGNAEDHYPTMKLEDICNLPVKDLAADDCVLFLWATYPMLKEAEVLIVDKHGLIYEIDAIMFGGLTEKRITPTNCERVLLAHIGEHIDAVGWYI